MSELLPAVPKPGTKVAARDVEAIERHVVENIGRLDSIEEASEWRAQARALEAYLRGRDLQAPILGAQRRIEARIGELLGEAKRGGRAAEQLDSRMRESLPRPDDRADFRILARGLNGCELSDEEWRTSRRALVALIRSRIPWEPPPPPKKTSSPPSGTREVIYEREPADPDVEALIIGDVEAAECARDEARRAYEEAKAAALEAGHELIRYRQRTYSPDRLSCDVFFGAPVQPGRQHFYGKSDEEWYLDDGRTVTVGPRRAAP